MPSFVLLFRGKFDFYMKICYNTNSKEMRCKMYITLDILQKRGACQEYLDFFAKRFPDGVEMLHMIERGHMPYHALHWGYK
jgi:hypothetical protein